MRKEGEREGGRELCTRKERGSMFYIAFSIIFHPHVRE